ncbi:WD40 repeat-like protein [Martensiomyces pterosporus]|nr:WD40 repeat-like protein [Martensiomyces pterosporus]
MDATKTELIACACNRTAHALDWLHDSLIAFGAGNFVALYNPSDPHSKGTYATLQGHTDRVNVVRFARDISGNPVDVFVSGSADCTARVWARNGSGDGYEQWECVAVLEGHKNPIIALAATELGTGHIIVVTASTDGTLRVFEYQRGSKGGAELVQVVDVGARNALDVALAALPVAGADDSNTAYTMLLATGNTDNCIHLYVRGSAPQSQFSKSIRLTGHEDWVNSLAFLNFHPQSEEVVSKNSTIAHWQKGDVILASGSEDKYIRLWRISLAGSSPATAQSDSAINVGSKKYAYAVSLDSVLVGHDGWVHSVAWNQSRAGVPVLVSASSDSSVIVWAPDADAGVWSSVARLGEVGGAILGFLGAVMDPAGDAIFAHGYHGSFHMWNYRPESGSASGEDAAIGPAYSNGYWEPQVSLSGHFGSVQDVAWDPQGSYLLSLSTDQTARLYAPWTSIAHDNSTAKKGWHEIARPQIHGYDMRCAAFVTPFQYVSGADEKVVRVFQATQQFVSSWRSLTHSQLPVAESEAKLAVGASLPVLGLSNKAVEEEQVRVAREASEASGGAGQASNDNYEIRQTHTEVQATASILAKDGGGSVTSPPLEEHLLRHTLWPEVDKLYGHPYEIFSVAASHSGDWIATSCKAASEKHANIRLYSTRTWQPPPATRSAAPLSAHALTITRLRFSPPTAAGDDTPTTTATQDADKYLLSVSRDRSWAVFTRVQKSTLGPYRLAHRQMKAHARIIWDAAWAPDARFFATASRDKSVKLWPTPANQAQDSGYRAKPLTLSFPEAVTAVDFIPAVIKGGNSERLQPFELPRSDAHIAMVHRLAWRPQPELGAVTEEQSWQLASGSDDQSVRVTRIDLARLQS